jgi:hypothetical protein
VALLGTFCRKNQNVDNPADASKEWDPLMKTLFLGHFAATVAPRILAKVKTPLETSIARRRGRCGASRAAAGGRGDRRRSDLARWVPAGAAASAVAIRGGGLDLLDTSAVPKGVTICNVFVHEPADGLLWVKSGPSRTRAPKAR